MRLQKNAPHRCAVKGTAVWGILGNRTYVLAADNQQNAGHEGENRQDEVVVCERQVDEAEEGPEEEPDAEDAKAEVAGRGICHEWKGELWGVRWIRTLR